jgi:hypothetical protein
LEYWNTFASWRGEEGRGRERRGEEGRGGKRREEEGEGGDIAFSFAFSLSVLPCLG